MKKLIHYDDECSAYVLDPGETLDLSGQGVLTATAPSEIYVLPEGSRTNHPAIAFVMPLPGTQYKIAMQLTLAKLYPAIEHALKLNTEQLLKEKQHDTGRDPKAP
jgi:hypothetical protein